MSKKKKIFKTIGKFALLIAIVGAIAGISYGILYACGFTTVDKFQQLRNDMGESIWFWAIIVALQVFQTIFIPISNQLITGATAILFNDQLWKVWLSAGVGITIGSIILYFLGRFGGAKLLKFLLGDEEQAEKCKKGMNKGKGFYIIGMFIPFIPDDVLSVLAGMAKYKIMFVIPLTIVARFTCTAFTTWGVGLLTKYWWMWIVLGFGIALMIFATIVVWKITFRKDKKVEKGIEPQF